MPLMLALDLDHYKYMTVCMNTLKMYLLHLLMSLPTVETRYGNTEREALAIFCGFSKFHYCFGRLVKVKTDH